MCGLFPLGNLTPCLFHNPHHPTPGASCGCKGFLCLLCLAGWESQPDTPDAPSHLSKVGGRGQAGSRKEATVLKVAMSLFVWQIRAMCLILLESRWQEF